MLHSLNDIYSSIRKNDLIVVLYSGGLDGTYLLSKLKEEGYTNLLALHIDIEDTYSFSKIHKRLKDLKIKYQILPLTNEFVENYILNSIYSQAKYLGGHPLSASLSRPLIAQKAIEYLNSKQTKVGALLHTSNSSQNSLRRFNTAIKNLNYEHPFGSPFEKSHLSREEKLKYLQRKNIALDLHTHSEDSNIWCREFEYGNFDNIENIEIPEHYFLWTKKNNNQPNELITLQFKQGRPISINNEQLSLKEIIIKTRSIVGKYGIGRFIGLEEIQTGEKVLEIRETPSASILLTAYKNLELATISSETARVKNNIEQVWVREASEGRWFSELRNACDSFCKQISLQVTGSVTFKLFENNFQLTSLKADRPNYITNRDFFEKYEID